MTEENKNPQTIPDESGVTEEKTYVYKGKEGKEFHLPAEFKDEMQLRLNIERSKVKSELQVSIDELTTQNQKLAKEMETFKKSQMTEQEQIELEIKEKENRLLKAEQKAENNWKMYADHKVSNDIIGELSSKNLYNPKQALTLLKAWGKTELVPEGDSFKTVIKVGDRILSIPEAVDEFIKLDENSNLIRNSLSAGGGTTKTGSSATDVAKMSNDEYMRWKDSQLNK